MNPKQFLQIHFRIAIVALTLLLLKPAGTLADEFDLLENNSPVAFAPKVFHQDWMSYKIPSVSIRIATLNGKSTIQIRDDGDVNGPTFVIFLRSMSGEIRATSANLVVSDRVTTLNAASPVNLGDARYLPDAEWAKIADQDPSFDKKDAMKRGWNTAKALEPAK
jgi:hypothetical protein